MRKSSPSKKDRFIAGINIKAQGFVLRSTATENGVLFLEKPFMLNR